MNDTVFQHPNRFPKNASGPFYTTGFPSTEPDENGNCEWGGNCLWCGQPEAEAPELFFPFDDKSYTDTYFVRQPETPEETEQAIMAAKVCCVFAVRYGGQDLSIIRRLDNDPELCDYISVEGELRLTVADDGEFLPFAAKIVKKNRAEWRRQNKKWWQFWL
jgi:hypothetical protein